MPEAIGIAIVGAESTGKTTLAQTLATRLAAGTGQRVAWVPEVLREWCEHAGRTPQVQEQAAILRAQHERISAAGAEHDIVVCDTTALMTAVYSQLLFADRTLHERAAQLHRRSVSATLLTAIDLPWVSDGLQRDGPQVREPVDAALRELMQGQGIAYAVVGGQGEARVLQALAAVAPLLRNTGPDGPQQTAGSQKNAGRAQGLFTGLESDTANRRASAWACECCLPDQERALRRSRSQ